jgi:magnesium-transporting ATPase (P-type)
LLPAYGFLGLLEAAVAMIAFFVVLHRGGWTYGQPLADANPLYRRATTACLIAIVMSQVANVFACRSERTPTFRSARNGLGLILLGILAELGLVAAIAYGRPAQFVMGTAPVEVRVWLFILPMAVAILVLEEMRKLLSRRLWPGTLKRP